MTELAEGRWLTPADLDTTINCRTPGCMQEAKAKTGRNAYCDECRVRRGTMTADGKPINKTGAREANGSDPSPEDAPERIARGDAFTITAAKANGELTASVAVGQGPFETRSLELVEAGRVLDAALTEYALVKPKIAAALQAWREALEQLPDATNGHAPDVVS